MNPAMILALIQKGIFHGAEGPGKATLNTASFMRSLGGKSVGLGKRVGAAVGSGLSKTAAAAKQVPSALEKGTSAVKGAVEKGVFKTAEAIGNPVQSTAGLRKAIQPRLSSLGTKIQTAIANRQDQAPVIAPGPAQAATPAMAPATSPAPQASRPQSVQQMAQSLFGRGPVSPKATAAQAAGAAPAGAGTAQPAPAAVQWAQQVAQAQAGINRLKQNIQPPQQPSGFANLAAGAKGLAGSSARGLMAGGAIAGGAVAGAAKGTAGAISAGFGALTDVTSKVVHGFSKLVSGDSGVSKVTGYFGKVFATLKTLGITAAIATAIVGLKSLAKEISESNRRLARFNGQIAASFAQLDIQRLKLDIQTARATSGTASELNKQLGEVLREFQPIREQLGILVNIVGIKSAQFLKFAIDAAKKLSETVEFLKGLHDLALDMEKELKKGKDDKFPGNAIIDALAGLAQGGPAAPLRPGGVGPRPFLKDARGNAFGTPEERRIWERLKRHKGI